MKGIICSVCGSENDTSNYYCNSCGVFLQKDRFEGREIAGNTEIRMKRIIENLLENPHYPIIWNETIDAYTRKVERIQSLIRIKEMRVKNGELSGKIDDFLTLCRKPDFQIAFVGTIKTGKSTLINALLGHNYASIDVTPETAVLTKFRSSERDYVHVTFYSEREWAQLWKTVQKGADKFLEKYYELNADKEKDKWLGHLEEHIELENCDIENELTKWSSSKSAIHYFVKEIEVGISTLPKSFPRQVVFVDTPGLSDPVQYRSQISKNYIHKANAVFVCVDAAKIYKEEIETIASVFSFSSHNKNKVHIIATHWDTLNDPIEDWEKQRQHMAEQLTGKAFYDSREIASKKIMYSAAYIYNLCRDYEYLEKKEKKALYILPMKLDMDVEPGVMTNKDLDKLMDICNIRKINQVIVDELVSNYSKLLYEDIEHLYKDILYIVRRVSRDRKKELQERIAMSNADISALEEKVLEKKRDNEMIRETQEQLKAALKSLEKQTQKRLDSILAIL